MVCTPFLYLSESGPAAGSQNISASAGIGVRLLFQKRFLVNAGRNALKALKYADKRVDILKAKPLRASFDIRRTRAVFFIRKAIRRRLGQLL